MGDPWVGRPDSGPMAKASVSIAAPSHPPDTSERQYMATHIPTKDLVLVFVSAGVANGASGWGITANGKLKKIPDNNPIGRQLAAAAQALAAVEGSGRIEQMQDLA